MAVERPGDDPDPGPRRQHGVPQLRLFFRPAHDSPHRRIDAHRLLHDLLEIGEPGEVLRPGRLAVQLGLEMFHEPRLDFGMRGEEVERPRERHGGRLVPREDQCHGLVPDLAVVHSLAGLFVAGREEPAQEVVAAVSAGPARFHESVDDAVQTLHGPLPPAVVDRGDPRIERQERAQVRGGQVDDFQDLGHFAGVLLDVAPEERLTDDVEGQLAHLPVDPDGVRGTVSIPPVQQG